MPAFLLQVQTADPTTVISLVTNASGVSQAVLGLLAALSLVSWTLIVAGWRALGATLAAGRLAVIELGQVSSLAEAVALARHRVPSAFTRLYTVAMTFVRDARDQAHRDGRSAGLTAPQVETLRLLLEAEVTAERDRLGRFLPWLATIGSVSPLIGLFGTVLGVIDAFVGIASQGSGNLAAVAPGVAEALIATAAALAVAIPATFAYNILAHRLNRVDALFETVDTAMLALLAREGHV